VILSGDLCDDSAELFVDVMLALLEQPFQILAADPGHDAENQSGRGTSWTRFFHICVIRDKMGQRILSPFV
jgi:hypothetical protein